MSVRFKCDECNATVKLADDRLGKRNYCPRCDARLPTAAVHRNTGLVLGLMAGGFVFIALAVIGLGIGAWYSIVKAPPPAAAPPPAHREMDEDAEPAFFPPEPPPPRGGQPPIDD
ncbi:MAG TPA: hypothetical protein VKE40_06325 [Gemmataceae bacterium]|nr:hypothetical protein [Gemmataceae bacterium]